MTTDTNSTPTPDANANPPMGNTLSNADKKTLLDQHNMWRAKYNMPTLVWDDAVATVAQDWANQQATSGTFEHRQNNKFGENLWSGTMGSFPVISVVDSWGNEVNDYDLKTNTCADGKDCGHFTQVIWFNTSKLGCGRATSADGNDIVVCNYDPSGNFTGQSPFGK